MPTRACGECYHFKPKDSKYSDAGYCLREDMDSSRYITFKSSTACYRGFISKDRTDVCVPGRMQHRFRSNNVRTKLSIQYDADITCWWCGKTFGEIMKLKREMGEKK
jgi:hypothetical protein